VIAREQRDFRRAAQCLTLARAVAEGRRDLLLAAEIAREQAELAWLQRQSKETLRHLNRAHRIFREIRAERSAADVDRRLGSLEASFLDIVRGWSASIESADRYTRGHCDRVAEYACALAAESGFDSQTLFWFRMGAILHDVGKIVVPGDILNKPGALTPDERAVMQGHPVAGVEILADIDFPWDILPMVRNHHEQWSGRGYPDGLAGEAIPLAARILCVADVYDALTSERPYRAAYTHARALEVMRSMEGSFDPVLFERFAEIAVHHPEWPIASAPALADAPAVAAPLLARSA
jgi:putative nucleotidyltransferase with HDIG domain